MKPKFLIIHHTATNRDTTTFEAVKKNHISRGWGDIGYHYFITPKSVYSGRAKDLVGAHCKADDMNFKSLGICLTGNFQNETPAQFQLDELTELANELCGKYSIPKDNILGHKEVQGAATACPGNNLLPFVKSLRVTSPKKYTEEKMTKMRLERDVNWNKFKQSETKIASLLDKQEEADKTHKTEVEKLKVTIAGRDVKILDLEARISNILSEQAEKYQVADAFILFINTIKNKKIWRRWNNEKG